MPEIDWLRRWEEKHEDNSAKEEVANMDALDFVMLLEEIEHR